MTNNIIEFNKLYLLIRNQYIFDLTTLVKENNNNNNRYTKLDRQVEMMPSLKGNAKHSARNNTSQCSLVWYHAVLICKRRRDHATLPWALRRLEPSWTHVLIALSGMKQGEAEVGSVGHDIRRGTHAGTPRRPLSLSLRVTVIGPCRDLFFLWSLNTLSSSSSSPWFALETARALLLGKKPFWSVHEWLYVSRVWVPPAVLDSSRIDRAEIGSSLIQLPDVSRKGERCRGRPRTMRTFPASRASRSARRMGGVPVGAAEWTVRTFYSPPPFLRYITFWWSKFVRSRLIRDWKQHPAQRMMLRNCIFSW